jgi:DNA-directed RNA polymerase alpha subunit
MSRYAFYRREWLNVPGEGNAFIEAQVDNPHQGRDHVWYEGGELTIKDCTRQINLSFRVSARYRENSLAKIATLLEVIEQFQAFLLHSANMCEKAEKEHHEKLQEMQIASGLRDDECDCPACNLGGA